MLMEGENCESLDASSHMQAVRGIACETHKRDLGWTVLALLEVSYFGNEGGIMVKNNRTGRRYSAEGKAAAVRMVRNLRAVLRTD